MIGEFHTRHQIDVVALNLDVGISVEEYLGHPLDDPKPVEVSEVHDHLGWHEQGDGKLWLGVPVENGRIKDDGDLRLMSGLRTYFERYGTPARFTCQQKVLLVGIAVSLVARTGFIFLGAALIDSFAWVFYIFGLILLVTAGNLLRQQGGEEEAPDNIIIRVSRRVARQPRSES